jgi:hypothetical protein
MQVVPLLGGLLGGILFWVTLHHTVAISIFLIRLIVYLIGWLALLFLDRWHITSQLDLG